MTTILSSTNHIPFNLETDPVLNHLMMDVDEIFSEVVASFDPILPEDTKLMDASVDAEAPATSALGAAFSLEPESTPFQDASYMTVTPNSSSTMLSSYAEAAVASAEIVDPSRIAEITIAPAPACISPAPRTGSTTGLHLAPKAKISSMTSTKSKKIVAIKAKTTATMSKKRKYSSTSTATATSQATLIAESSASSGFVHLDEATIEEQRRQRNRDHARKSRLRKKSLTGNLQRSLEELKLENAKLREQVYQIIGPKKTERMVNQKLIARNERFIETLKKPENRVVDTKTLSFLKGLRTKMVSSQTTANAADQRSQVSA